MIVDQFGREIVTARRNHAAAARTRFTSDWITSDSPLDRYLTRDLTELQNRSTSLEMDEGYYRRILDEIVVNVIGDKGTQFNPMCRKADGRAKNKKPGKDDAACEAIRQAFEKFSQKENFTASRRFSRRRFEQLAVREVAVLGGLLIREIEGFQNPFGFAVHPVSIRNLNPRLNNEQQRIHMGIEFDQWDAPVAYHVLKRRNKADQSRGRETERLDAKNTRHLFVADGFDQSRGKPWLTASMLRLRMLGKYEEAETIAAIEHANNTTYFEQNEFTEYTGEEDEQGNIREKSEPGQKTILPKGLKATQVQPTHPNAAYPEFRKAVLRGIVASCPANYNVIANDLEGVNFSSIRQGTLSEREAYKVLQCWFIDDFCIPIFKKWLRQSILTGELGQFSMADIERLSHVEFAGRRWSWVDPLKDITAAEKSIALSITSRGKIIREIGNGDFDTIVEENERETKKMIDAGLTPDPSAKPEPAPTPEPESEEDDEEEKKAA